MIINDDCFKAATQFEPNSLDAIITSPPYAQQRKKQYGGISEEAYPDWTVNWANCYRAALKDTGSIAIVIRPHIKDGQISDYVLKTRLAMRADWIEAEELIWIKPDSPPLGNIVRPRRAWESILWFSKTRKPYCDAKANGAISDRVGFESIKGVGDYKSGVSPAKTGIARCRDYVEVGTGSVDKSSENTHPAQYPERLAIWLIKLLCPMNGTILDPFMGSGTTLVAAQTLNKTLDYDLTCHGVEISSEYNEIALKRLAINA